MKSNSTGKPVEFYKLGKEMFDRIKPLSPNKPAIEKRVWVGLTDAEKNGCLVSADPCECLATPEAQQLMEDVETKLKEKNT